MNPELLKKLIDACLTGSPEVQIGRKVTQCAADSLHIKGGKVEILAIIGGMTVADFTPANGTNRVFLNHPLKLALENYHFNYMDDRSYLSFFSLRAKDANGKIQLLDGFGIKSFHLNGYYCL
ncbi:MAG: hypothetical protein ABIW76_22650 [Fibrobacteria bacterium]